jgi:hypothetical protein
MTPCQQYRTPADVHFVETVLERPSGEWDHFDVGGG